MCFGGGQASGRAGIWQSGRQSLREPAVGYERIPYTVPAKLCRFSLGVPLTVNNLTESPSSPLLPGPRFFYACRAIRLYEATTPRLHSGQPLFAVCRPVCAWQIGRPTASYFANSISLGFRTAAARDCEAGTAKKGGWAGSGDGAGAEECCSAGRRYMCTELPTGFPVSRVPDVQIRVAGGGAGGGGRVVGAMNK